MSKAPMIMSANVASPIDLNEFARRAALKMEEHDFHGFEPVVLAVVEEMLAVGDGQNIEDERAAFEADFICRWKSQNPKAFEGAVDVQASVFEMLLKRRADGEYENLVPREAWFSWQSSANRLARTEPECGCCGQIGECDADCDTRMVEPDPAQDELESFKRWAEVEYNVNPNTEELNLSHIEVKASLKGWQARATRPAQTEQQLGLRHTDQWESARVADYNAGWNDRHTAEFSRLTDDQIFDIAESFGEFRYGDAQGDKRLAFARAIIAATAAPVAQPAPKPSDDSLIQNAKALLALDARKALEPHGIGGLAREVIESLIARLESGACIAQAGSVQYGRYETKPAESLAGIALRQLQDESRWVEIRDLNAHAFPDMGPHDYYPVGTVLTMPAVPAAQAEQLIPWIADAPSRSEAAIVAIRDLWDEDECPSYPVVAHALRELLTTTPIDQPERK